RAPPPGLSQNTVLGHPGANVTLTCQDEGPANVTVTWRREERGPAARGGHGRQLPEGNTLLLRRLRHEDSGRYSCSGGGRPLRSLQLLVEGGCSPGLPPPRPPAPLRPPAPPCLAEPPETPRVSCYRRSHDKDVLCEWPLRAKPSPGTRAMLWV
ncbi:IL6RA protein, partial [Caloenas nicobarica]|nr:IL6RA protein [Caloenas nicobarica]